MSNRTPTNHPKTFMRLKPQTRPKVEAVARLKRWTLAETADAVFDDYLARHGIAVGGFATSQRHHRPNRVSEHSDERAALLAAVRRW